MRIKHLFKSTAFRLSLVYMALFSASAMVLLMFIYLETIKEIDTQIKLTINSQIGELSVTFHQDGAEETAKLINDMIEHDTEEMALYLLINKKQKFLAGNLEKWPDNIQQNGKWMTFWIENTGSTRDDKGPIQVLGRAITFKNGTKMLVGYNLKHLEQLQRVILNVLVGSIGITLIVAVTFGFITTHIISRRLETVNQACRLVMKGNLKERINVSGGGDAFDTLAENFNSMLAWISDLIAGIEDISHNIAHDLRSPLSRLRNRLENIVRQEMDPATTLTEIRGSIGEIDTLIQTFNAILRISQAQAGAGIEHFGKCNLAEILHNVIEFYLPLAEEKGLILRARIDDNIEINGDKHLLVQALANLVDNAIKYTPSGGKILIVLLVTTRYIEFSIADNGSGIPEAYYSKVKERFFRLDSSRSTHGSGLGLSLVDAVVKLHGGTMVFADNKPGLKVMITFPV